jgi:hypothetical protein
MFFIFKILISSILIAMSTEIAKKNPSVGGIILALPLVSIIAFAFMGYQGADAKSMSTYAKSTLVFVPISLVFFLPFAIPFTQGWSFLSKFILGISVLTIINIVLIKSKVLDL